MSDQKIKKEVRFAVVMYGGGSLAIYINGIAQELLKMVRATADDQQIGGDFKNTEKVYRQLALLLSDEELLKDIAGLKDKEQIKQILNALIQKNNESPFNSFNQVKEVRRKNQRTIEPDNGAKQAAQKLEEIRQRALKLNNSSVRFIIDVITGSSAGGINGVFLAKALANNQPIDDLKKLWLAEGDFAKLLNDKYSTANTPLKRPGHPLSLLNSQRMYLKLLEALDEMDRGQKLALNSPNVDELDLFVTVTDFTGVPVPVRLFDRVVSERRHRQFFHFKYKKGNGSHFGEKYNPFLAFAARSTSAFPLAFEPMRLTDIDNVIDRRFSEKYGDRKSNNPDWTEFFRTFKLPQEAAKNGDKEIAANCARFFVDGGALDNKPFGFAIETLLKRYSEVPVDRKLIYIEPSPEIFNAESGGSNKPDALENLLGQASNLPRYETIREDLEVLINRNRLIERVNRLIKNAERDKTYTLLSFPLDKIDDSIIGGKDWENYGLENIVRIKGHAFLPYYRLRLIAVTDGISRLVTQLLGFNEDSDYFMAIRSFVRGWREKTYSDYRKESLNVKQRNENEVKKENEVKVEEKIPDLKFSDDDPGTVNSFLRRFDVEYRVRRLRFVQQKAHELFRYDEDLISLLKKRKERETELRTVLKDEKNEYSIRRYYGLEKKIGDLSPSEIILREVGTDKLRTEKLEDLREAIYYFQEKLHLRSENLQQNIEDLSYGKKHDALFNELIANLKQIKLDIPKLKEILGETKNSANKPVFTDYDEEAFFKRAKAELEKNNDEIYRQLHAAAESLKKYLDKNIFEPSRQKIDELFKIGSETDDYREKREKIGDLFDAVRGYLYNYYQNFDDYDQISFPIFYQTPVGEADVVEIVRISPHDSQSLIDELNGERRKLAGDYLYGFGAFLDVRWRQNDITWGRLDGAERIITALLPNGTEYNLLREMLVREAHEEILEDEFVSSNRDVLNREVVAALLNAKAYGNEENFDETVSKMTNKLINSSVLKKELSGVFQTCLKESKDVYEAVKTGYEIDRSLEPKEALRLASRSTQITGKILEEIAERNAGEGNRIAWIARLGAIFWSLIEVAAPNSLLNLLFRHWLKLLYFFEAFLIIGGTLLVKTEIQNFGVVALLATSAVHLMALFLHDSMRGRNAWKKTIIAVLLVACVIFALLGIFLFLALFFIEGFWNSISEFRDFLSGLPTRYKILPGVLLGTGILLALIWNGIKQYRVERRFRKDLPQ